MIGLSFGTHGTDLEIDCWYIRESLRKVPALLHGSHNQNSLGAPDRNRPVSGFKKNGLRNCSRPEPTIRSSQVLRLGPSLVQHSGQASEWPGTELIPSGNINQGSEKKFSYSFRKVPVLLYGGNNQNSLGVPDRNQIVRGFKKNGLIVRSWL